ncbi:hypothetical protein GA0070606_0875 [Micromonospora citrea]|uniref:Lipoprotein n=1 Tax=Micromonospora citrea TaxID=47855 RepID=A0A1C6TVS2_9ACTN|nr:hypothetical protein [Micromonospora citrea]SCL45857.1 hypothetical protein GA0070606_0875 [Micromonospora citrea]
MPAASTTLRVLAVSVIASLTVTGCQTADALGQADRALGQAALADDLASLTDRTTELTYSADYLLAGGQAVTIAQTQDPARSTYTWPGGRLIVTWQATTHCETAAGRATCTLEAPPVPDVLNTNTPMTVLHAETKRRGLVAPLLVMQMLTDAALDSDVVFTRHSTTLAGHRATCFDVRRSAGDFTACVTAQGALGSFTGQVDGKPVELTLTRYRETVDGTAFDLPAGAAVVDRRTATS